MDEVLLFHSFSLELGLGLDEHLGGLLLVVVVLLEISEVVLQGLVDLDLDEFFEGLVLFSFKFDICFF